MRIKDLYYELEYLIEDGDGEKDIVDKDGVPMSIYFSNYDDDSLMADL